MVSPIECPKVDISGYLGVGGGGGWWWLKRPSLFVFL